MLSFGKKNYWTQVSFVTKYYNASKIDTYTIILKTRPKYVIWFMSHKQ